MTELRHGVVDIGLITPIYVRGGTHLIRAQAAFYGGLTTFQQQVALYHCMQQRDPQFAHELDGLVVLAVQGGNLPGIVTRNRRVETLGDLQGLRLRAPAELLPVLRHLGADPVEMPMGEVYSALAKGVLDGVVAPKDTLKSLHFAEVTHYFNTLDIPRGAYAARAMGAKRWQSLSDAQRAILSEGVAVWEHALETPVARRGDRRRGRRPRTGRDLYRTAARGRGPVPRNLRPFRRAKCAVARAGSKSTECLSTDTRALVVEYQKRHGQIDCNGDGA